MLDDAGLREASLLVILLVAVLLQHEILYVIQRTFTRIRNRKTQQRKKTRHRTRRRIKFAEPKEEEQSCGEVMEYTSCGSSQCTGDVMFEIQTSEEENGETALSEKASSLDNASSCIFQTPAKTITSSSSYSIQNLLSGKRLPQNVDSTCASQISLRLKRKMDLRKRQKLNNKSSVLRHNNIPPSKSASTSSSKDSSSRHSADGLFHTTPAKRRLSSTREPSTSSRRSISRSDRRILERLRSGGSEIESAF